MVPSIVTEAAPELVGLSKEGMELLWTGEEVGTGV